MKLRSISPHDQSVIGELDVSTKKDIGIAITKAKLAFEQWRALHIKERLDYVKKYRKEIIKHKEKLARLTTLEMGKPIYQSLSDIDRELSFLDYYIEKGAENLADELVFKTHKENYRVVFDPYGVCACIAPWNFPLSMVNSGAIPALIAGNTVVFKPSEHTSLTQKLAINLLQKTGIPHGVVNLLIGAGRVGEMLVDSAVDFVWFTGSTAVGQEIYRKCGDKFIKAVCELGGSGAGIVFADNDLNKITEKIYWARFFNSGQVCNAIKRLFIEKPIYDDFLELFLKKIKSMRVGNPLEKVDIGPLVSKGQVKKIEQQVTDAVEKGAKVEIGGKRIKSRGLSRGNYFEPTILTHVNFEMKVMTEETFGPILPIMPFSKESEVIEITNKSDYGLTSEIYTADIARGERMAQKIHTGVVAINASRYHKPMCPIGGYKKSGIGREYGRIGMQEFTRVKLIAIEKVKSFWKIY